MTSFVVSGLVQTSQTLVGGESGIVTSTGTLAVAGAPAISGSSSTGIVDLMILGDVIGVGSSAFSSAVDISTSTARVFSSGTVVGSWRGFEIESIARLDFSNSGTVEGYASAAELRITSGAANGQLYCTNSGVMQGQGNGLELVANDASRSVLTNTGTIIGTNGTGVLSKLDFGVSAAGPISIHNSGTIMGSSAAIDSYYHVTYVFNTGLLVGEVYLSVGADAYFGKLGEVQGTVYGNLGDDLLITGEAGDVVFGGQGEDRLYGNGGDDSLNGESAIDNLYGGAGDDTLDGGTENDVLRGGRDDDLLIDDYGADFLDGNLGDDTLLGGLGNDTLWGGNGADTLSGGAEFDLLDGGLGNDSLFGDGGGDTLFGQKGDDTLDGSFNNDTLYGGAGDDVLIGGQQRDDLFGGTDADVFLFAIASDSPNSALADTIRDFEVGVDLIDLEAVSGSVLQFQGLGGAFAGGGTASLRITQTTNTIIWVDFNGDATADMRIQVTGLVTLSAADFVL